MKITIENTDQMVELLVQGVSVPARLWLGKTESGVAVEVLVTRIAVPSNQDLSQFEKELDEQRAPVPLELAFPLRMVL